MGVTQSCIQSKNSQKKIKRTNSYLSKFSNKECHEIFKNKNCELDYENEYLEKREPLKRKKNDQKYQQQKKELQKNIDIHFKKYAHKRIEQIKEEYKSLGDVDIIQSQKQPKNQYFNNQEEQCW